MRHIIPILTLGLLLSCGAHETPPKTATPPNPPTTSGKNAFWRMDPDIERLFGADAPLRMQPHGMQFSKDSAHLAFLRDTASATELWVHHVDTGVETPLITGKTVQVTSFSWVGSDRIAAIADGDVWLVDLSGKRHRITNTPSKERDVQASPDGTKAAYLRDHNLILVDLVSMIERPLTQEGSAKRTFGEVTWLYEEEFETEHGFAWSPAGDRLWFMETDLEDVPFRTIDLSNGKAKRMPYPRPGEPNPVVTVWALDLRQPKPIRLRTGQGRDVYLPRVTWHPSGDAVVVTELDRLQTKLTLERCEIATRPCHPVLTEADPRYVDLLGDPVFMNAGKEMLWLSERTGYAHIERVRLSDGARTPLTEGMFEVTAIDHVDEDAKRVLFTANAENTGEQHLYAVSLDGGPLKTLPQAPGTHECLFAQNGQVYVDTHSAVDRPPSVELNTIKGEPISSVFQTGLQDPSGDGVLNEIFSIDNDDGIPLMAHLTRPAAISPKTRYPVLVITYGGPHVQLAANQFHPIYQPWRDLLANRGIIVFSVDGRGSFGRGHVFESAIRLNLGVVELEDQLAGLAYLKTLPFVAPDRIGIFGWSYGGYMVLNALLRAKASFRFGVSVAPVTDWRYYDTAYTERYMQRPEDNPKGYQQTSLLPLAGRLTVPLLLVHGMADDNVHLIHSYKMLEAFLDADRNVTPLFYPGKDHKIGGPATRVHLFTHITRFIEEHI